jgi:DNA-binding NarL/FixJ family response regulator
LTNFEPDQRKMDDFLPKDSKKFHRRKKILSLKLKGKKNLEISQRLGYSLSTIEKDLHSIRKIFGKIFKQNSMEEDDVE